MGYGEQVQKQVQDVVHLYRYAKMGSMAGHCDFVSQWSDETQQGFLQWKTSPNPTITKALAYRIVSCLPNKQGWHCVTTAPKKKERLDNYHPSTDLAKAVARLIHTPFVQCFAQRKEHRNKGSRGGAFAIKPEPIITFSGQWVLLVDDVVCSGATVITCAQALRELGNQVESMVAVFWDKSITLKDN